jgi:hypothetical protein
MQDARNSLIRDRFDSASIWLNQLQRPVKARTHVSACQIYIILRVFRPVK